MGRANKQRKALRRRQRGGRIANPRSSAFPSRMGRRDLERLTYAISSEPLDLPEEADPALYRVLSEEDREVLHDQIHHDPALAVQKLQDLRERHPHSQMLLNWLASAHSRVGDHEKAEELMRLNYELHPNYFFARINYAQVCLGNGELDRVREIFDDKFDLKLMYPHRNVFHISEFTAFCSVAVEYLMRTGEIEAAHNLFDVLEDMCPDHPVTNQLRPVLEGSLLLRLAKRLQQRMLASGLLPRR